MNYFLIYFSDLCLSSVKIWFGELFIMVLIHFFIDIFANFNLCLLIQAYLTPQLFRGALCFQAIIKVFLNEQVLIFKCLFNFKVNTQNYLYAQAKAKIFDFIVKQAYFIIQKSFNQNYTHCDLEFGRSLRVSSQMEQYSYQPLLLCYFELNRSKVRLMKNQGQKLDYPSYFLNNHLFLYFSLFTNP